MIRILVILLLLTSVAHALDVTITIPDAKKQRVIDAMKGLYAIPQINTGTVDNPAWENEFTDGQWAKESVRRWIVKQVLRYERLAAKNSAAKGVVKDNTIAQ